MSDEPQNLEAPQFESAQQKIGVFFAKVKKILFDPAGFFETVAPNEPLSTALFFAVLLHWLGTAIDFIYVSLLWNWADRMNEFFIANNQGAAFVKIWTLVQGVGGVLLDPFFMLLSLFVLGVFTYFGATLFIKESVGASRKPTFEDVVRILAYGMTGKLCRVLIPVPVLNSLVGSLWTFFICSAGFSKTFKISGARSAWVVLFPSLVLMTVIFMTTLFVILFFAGFLSKFFGF